MKRFFKLALVTLVIGVTILSAAEAHQIMSQRPMPIPSLNVTVTSSTTVDMSWTAFGDGNYRVTITDLTANEVLKTFNTTGTGSVIGGPVDGAIGGAIGGLRGHTVRFMVESSAEFIVIDIVIAG